MPMQIWTAPPLPRSRRQGPVRCAKPEAAISRMSFRSAPKAANPHIANRSATSDPSAVRAHFPDRVEMQAADCAGQCAALILQELQPA